MTEPGSQTSGLGRILLALLVLGAVLVFGTALVLMGYATSGMSRAVYFLVDTIGFGAVFGCAFLLSVLAVIPPIPQKLTGLNLTAIRPALVATATLGLSVLGVQAVYHGFAFSLDEWMTRFQADIFLAGKIATVVPEEWREYGRAMYHGFASYDPNSGLLASNYRPGMSLLYAFFESFGLGRYTSAVLNAVAIVLVARVARQIFPQSNEAPIVAALLLATSQQALATSMTSYAMTAHLCFNLLWLTLFLNDRWSSHVMAALVGVATAALHQVHFHLFFALPFLLTLLRPFRFGLVLLYGSVYLVGHLAIFGWDWVSFNSAIPAVGVETGSGQPKEAAGILTRAMNMASLPSWQDISTVTANLIRMFAWQSLAVLPLLFVAFGNAAKNRYVVLLWLSFFVSLLPYPILMPDQGHGWGYRYLHGLLGHLALLAIPGWIALRNENRSRNYLSWVIACLLLSPIALIPFRAYQIEKMVSPYANASAFIAVQDADVVLVNNDLLFYGHDLPRSKPINPTRPLQMKASSLTPGKIKALCDNYQVLVLGPVELETFGLHSMDQDTMGEVLNESAFARLAAIEECRK